MLFLYEMHSRVFSLYLHRDELLMVTCVLMLAGILLFCTGCIVKYQKNKN